MRHARGTAGSARSGRRWPHYLILTIFGGVWTALMLAVGLADESNTPLPPTYYVLLFGGLFLTASVAFGIARASGRARGRSLVTALLVAAGGFFAPLAAMTAAIVASGGV